MTTALYRRYRPETFAEVIGQDHVTAPLRQALRNGQVNHAYLFSGPRGCGKTSSARILARILNCAANTAEQPTDTPCGQCESCVELATGGPGSLDVVEIDAASHGGVDDARELRERATFAPARDRFKVFILDEAHMVTPQGFNALLKIVEEPPPHVKFVFATTEPDKVIGTIRSRTHHYPFRLVPPDVLLPYLEQLCGTEGVPVGPGVLSLVVRAGAGSVRDSLSVLDQLIAGAGPEGLVYEGAVDLLGYTHATLLDDLVDAVAARDGASAFRVVEKVIASGHEPRRFVEDLLERLRDLIVIQAAGEAAGAVLRDLPADQLERMRAQAGHLGAAELSRSADLSAVALTEMTGATSPRLQLELLMARLLLPAVDDDAVGLAARLDRLERGAAFAPTGASVLPPGPGPAPTSPAAVPVSSAPSAGATTPAAPAARPAMAPPANAAPVPSSSAASSPSAPTPPAPASSRSAEPDPAGSAASTAPVTSPPAAPPASGLAPGAPVAPEVSPVAVAPASVPAAPPHASGTTTAQQPTGSGPDTEVLRRRWPEVLAALGPIRRNTWALVSQRAQVHSLDATTLKLAFETPGLAERFRSDTDHAAAVARAVREQLGFDVRVEGVLLDDVASRATPARGAPAAPGVVSPEQAAASWEAPARPAASAGAVSASPPGVDRPAPTPRPSGAPPSGTSPDTSPLARPDTAQPGVDAAGGSAPSARPAVGPSRPALSSAVRPVGTSAEPDPPEPPDDDDPGPDDPGPVGFAGPPPPWDIPAEPTPASRRPAPPGPSAGPAATARATAAALAEAAVPAEPDDPSPDDPDITSSGLVGAPLVAQVLGGRVIDEQVDDSIR